MSEQNIENVEGDVNVEAPEAPEAKPEESPAENPTSGDTDGDDAQQDTGALQD